MKPTRGFIEVLKHYCVTYLAATGEAGPGSGGRVRPGPFYMYIFFRRVPCGIPHTWLPRLFDETRLPMLCTFLPLPTGRMEPDERGFLLVVCSRIGQRYGVEAMSATGTLWDLIRDSGTGAGDAVREVSEVISHWAIEYRGGWRCRIHTMCCGVLSAQAVLAHDKSKA